jgi:hypothetical protein
MRADSTYYEFIKTMGTIRFIFQSGLSAITLAQGWLLLVMEMDSNGEFLERISSSLRLPYEVYAPQVSDYGYLIRFQRWWF